MRMHGFGSHMRKISSGWPCGRVSLSFLKIRPCLTKMLPTSGRRSVISRLGIINCSRSAWLD